MAEQYGVETLKKIAESVAEVLNVGSKVMNKQGLWHLISLKDVVEFWTKVDLRTALAELKNCSEPEREEVEKAFKVKLDLVNKAVETKIGTFIGLLEEVADIAENVYEAGEQTYEKVLEVVPAFKKLFASIQP